ncbi:hypothetical protein F5B22DRAFT_582534 [Xylaria bambusicola]|uniref:uncharacterized protein n=1 Tax=Xylaria bambusicola TaxID=326684 RepID=UPI0020075BB1|nr:uncharacterized protein F5B22DRAFT_582534 [Xylaria bambusicola]KAI0527834.1 hypothetical protein F5B22DRAFT_582534 [Xylaria bambusicola]
MHAAKEIQHHQLRIPTIICLSVALVARLFQRPETQSQKIDSPKGYLLLQHPFWIVSIIFPYQKLANRRT